MSAPEDVNVDDLRRRARRRLVGAIVLALAAAVFVPMLLESEPKPLGEDVSVKIPPVDDAKFVNKLSDKGKADAPKSAPAKAAEPKPPEPRVEEKSESAKVESPAPAKAETVAVAPKAEAPKTETAKAETPKSEPPTSEAKAEAPKAEALAEPAKRSASEPDARAGNGTAAKAANPAVHENGAGFSVQLAAFSDNYGANALSNKLKKLGYPAYTEPLQTSRGTLYRVRVGPYPSREAAAASRDKLKGEGYAGIVAPSK